MPEEPDVLVHPRGLREEFPEGPPTAVITHRGCRLILRFAEGDFHGEGDVQEIRLLPDTATLQPRVLRQFAPEAETYLAYARAAMRIFNPDVPFETRQENLAGESRRSVRSPAPAAASITSSIERSQRATRRSSTEASHTRSRRSGRRTTSRSLPRHAG